ncbi:UNVERIFIED_CONTAM: hypothetical protein FKN15_074778 [Acipenser sinensis]
MAGQLHFTPTTVQSKFESVVEELFRDGVNWGRIVAFFEFGGTMCLESVNREMTSQVDNIANWMTEYLNGPLQNWIQENGGWVCDYFTFFMEDAIDTCIDCVSRQKAIIHPCGNRQ